jgi:hypothetical protein
LDNTRQKDRDRNFSVLFPLAIKALVADAQRQLKVCGFQKQEALPLRAIFLALPLTSKLPDKLSGQFLKKQNESRTTHGNQ